VTGDGEEKEGENGKGKRREENRPVFLERAISCSVVRLGCGLKFSGSREKKGLNFGPFSDKIEVVLI